MRLIYKYQTDGGSFDQLFSFHPDAETTRVKEIFSPKVSAPDQQLEYEWAAPKMKHRDNMHLALSGIS